MSDDPFLPPPPSDVDLPPPSADDSSSSSGATNPFLARAQRFGLKQQQAAAAKEAASKPVEAPPESPKKSVASFKTPKASVVAAPKASISVAAPKYSVVSKPSVVSAPAVVEYPPPEDEPEPEPAPYEPEPEPEEPEPEPEPVKRDPYKSGGEKKDPYKSGKGASSPYARGGAAADDPLPAPTLFNPYEQKEESDSTRDLTAKISQLRAKGGAAKPAAKDDDDDLLPPPPSSSDGPSSKQSVAKPSAKASVSVAKPAAAASKSKAGYLPAAPEPAVDTSSADDVDEAERKARLVEKIKRQQAQYHSAVMSGTPLPPSLTGSGPTSKPAKRAGGGEDGEDLVADDGKGPWCSNCGGTLKGQQVLEVGGKEYHPRCFVCFHCRKPLTGQMLTVQTRYYHPACLLCKHCGVQLQGKSFVVHPSNNQVYCPEHARLTTPHSGGTVVNCGGCGLPISGKDPVVNAMNQQWHNMCFVCEYCKETLVGRQCVVQKGKPYCERDFDLLFKTKCAACKEAIEGSVLEIGSDSSTVSYHPTCFKCTSCDKVLKGSLFFLKGSNVYCEAHAS